MSKCWTRQPAGRARGFTLIEILVAFAIMALATGAVIQAFSSGLRGAGTAEGYATATLHAESKLEEVGISAPLEPGVSTGDFGDGYRWRLEISALDETGGFGGLPYVVTVTVSWDDDRSIELETLRLGPPS